MKTIFKSILCILGSALLFASCEQSPEVLDEITYTRVLTPTKFSAEVVPSTGTDVVLTWQKIKNAESYELEVYRQMHETQEPISANTGARVDMFAVSADEVPYTVYGLPVDGSFYARVRGVNPDLEPSNWVYLENTFSTFPVRNSLNPVVTARTQNSVTLAWDNATDKADLNTVLVEPVVLKGNEAAQTKVALEAADIAAASKTISGLQAGREYRFTLVFGKAGKRGSVTANTRPNIDGTPTVISSAAALLAALDNQAGTIKLMLDYADDAYDITSIYPDQTKKYATIVGDIYLYGNATEAGKKPTVKGLVFSLGNGAKKLHLEDVVFDGDGLDAWTVNNASAEMASVALVNSEMTGYAKGIYSSQGTGKVADFLVEGCYVHDINADGAATGDFIDVRTGVNGDFTVRNSTFYACARTFFRIGDSAKAGNVLAESCTFNYVTATPSSSNNAGIFAVRKVTEATSVKAIKNVFLNEYNEKEGDAADKGWVRLCRNSSDSYRVVCEGNVYFNMGVSWWISGAVAAPGDAVGEKSFEEIAKTDATILADDPCINSAAGKLYLAGTAGEQIRSLKAGDPRWWDAVMPVVVREKELTLVDGAYTWDFTQKTIYDTEELTANTIIGNARIYATATVPANVVMSKGVNFSTGASVSPAGVPTYSAVEVLVKDYGSVKVTATSEDGIGSMQVLAGGDRYAVLADGKEHTVTLGDLAGENSIYVIANSAVTLKKVAWTKDLTPETTVQKLATPVITVTPGSLDLGTAEDVVISWPAVANAADYVMTLFGAEQVLTEPTYTIAAADVAALAVGEYPVTVVARPVTTSSKYEKGDAGEAKLKILAPPASGEVTLTWDFTADYKSSWSCTAAKTYKYAEGVITEVAAATETEVLYMANGAEKVMKVVGKKSCTGDSKDYYPITSGGSGAYVFLKTAKSGTLKVTATAGKTASESNNNCDLGVRIGGATVGEDVHLVNYDLTKPGCNAVVYEWAITNTTGEVQEIQIMNPTGKTSPWIFKVEFVYTVEAAPVYTWDFTTEYKSTWSCTAAKTYKYEEGAITEVAAATETEVLYMANGAEKVMKVVGKKSCTGDSTDYYPITSGGSGAYVFLKTAKTGKLKVTATAGKTASESNNNCDLGVRIGGATVGEDVHLVNYDLTKPVCNAAEYEWTITNSTGDVQEIQIMKPTGKTSPWIFKVVFESD